MASIEDCGTVSDKPNNQKLTVTLEEWKKEAREFQLCMAQSLGDRIWDKYELPQDEDILKQKIAYVLFGMPVDSDADKQYTSEQNEIIKKFQHKCVNLAASEGNSNSICLSFVFFSAYKSPSDYGEFPLIRIMKQADPKQVHNSWFVDHCGRVYENWKHFLDTNIFEGWWICVPYNGVYNFVSSLELHSERVEQSEFDSKWIEWYDQTKKGKALRVTDNVASAFSISSMASGVLGLGMLAFPPCAPIGAILLSTSGVVAAATGIYGAGRSISGLTDRTAHKQTISVLDKEARSYWVNIALSGLSLGSMASMGILSLTARSGMVASPGIRVLCNALQITSISASAVGIFSHIHHIATKEDKITPLDILHLTTSILFFTHSVVSFRTAEQIIKNAQEQMINSKRDQLNSRGKRAFDWQRRANRRAANDPKDPALHGDAKFIRDLKTIDNPREFFKQFTVTKRGKLVVNRVVHVKPQQYAMLDENDRKALFDLAEQKRNGLISNRKFRSALRDLYSKQTSKVNTTYLRKSMQTGPTPKDQRKNPNLEAAFRAVNFAFKNTDAFRYCLDVIEKFLQFNQDFDEKKLVQLLQVIRKAYLEYCKRMTLPCTYDEYLQWMVKNIPEISKIIRYLLELFKTEPRSTEPEQATTSSKPSQPEEIIESFPFNELFDEAVSQLVSPTLKNRIWTKYNDAWFCTCFSDDNDNAVVRCDQLPDNCLVLVTLLSEPPVTIPIELNPDTDDSLSE